jgi:murein DD-endopeptidase MepM/ murein hydrolase activator NlpD
MWGKLPAVIPVVVLVGMALVCSPRSLTAESGSAIASANSQLRNTPSVTPGIAARFPALADPIEGASVSSGFGWRVHPILGVRKFHHGVDLAAPRGTPVHAAADGIVEEAGVRGGNGIYIRIRHGLQLLTSYSHLERVAANIRRGAWVTRDQVIGFVGMTGLATGPHLYYEVFVDGQKVNPLHPESASARTRRDDELATSH